MFQCFIFLVFRYNLKISREKKQNMLETISKHARSDFKTCSKRFQNMLEAISKHARSDATETLNLKLKHPYVMFQLCN